MWLVLSALESYWWILSRYNKRCVWFFPQEVGMEHKWKLGIWLLRFTSLPSLGFLTIISFNFLELLRFEEPRVCSDVNKRLDFNGLFHLSYNYITYIHVFRCVYIYIYIYTYTYTSIGVWTYTYICMCVLKIKKVICLSATHLASLKHLFPHL